MPKKSKPRREPEPTTEFLIPQPGPEAIAKLQRLYRKKHKKALSEDDAREVLSRIMRFQYVNILINTQYEQRLRERGESGEEKDAEVEPAHEVTGKPIEAETDAGGKALAGRARGAAALGLLLEPG